MPLSSTARRRWWRHPGPLIALVLHAVVFLGLFQIRFSDEERTRLHAAKPPGTATAEGFRALMDEFGPYGVVQWFFDNHGEIKLYHRYARLVLDGVDPTLPAEHPGQGRFEPYRDVVLEYQPGALLVLSVPGLVGRELSTYLPAFVVWCGLLYGASVWLGLRLLADGAPLTVGQANRALWGSLFFLLGFGVIAGARFDHAVPLACLAAIALLHRADRTGSPVAYACAGAWVAAGVLIKIVPGVVLPAALLWLGLFGPGPRWKESVLVAAGFATTCIALNALFLAWWGDGYVRSYLYHVERGIQLESLYAGLLLAGQGFGRDVSLVSNYGAAHLVTPWEPALKPLALPLFLLLGAGVAWRFRRCTGAARPKSVLALLWLTTSFLLAFILTNKVFSPQYLLWVGPPLVAAAAVHPAYRPGLNLLLVATVMSQAVFPHLYGKLAEFHPALVGLLNARNAIVLALFGWMLWRAPRLLPPASGEAGPQSTGADHGPATREPATRVQPSA